MQPLYVSGASSGLVLTGYAGGSHHTSTTDRITPFLQGMILRAGNPPGKTAGTAPCKTIIFKVINFEPKCHKNFTFL